MAGGEWVDVGRGVKQNYICVWKGHSAQRKVAAKRGEVKRN